MATYPFQPLQGFKTVFDSTLNNDISDGMVEYFDWGLLDKGNFLNVHKGQLSPDGFDCSKLVLSSDKNFPSGQVWEGFRRNWVWQSGVNYSPAPIVGSNNTLPGISGVYVNNTFYPTTTSGAFAHYVDYYNGRVVFVHPIPTGSLVQAEFSYKWINVYYANDLPWFRELQTNTEKPDASFFQAGKQWNEATAEQAQLPFIAIEVVPRRTFRGLNLGGGQWVYTDVLIHCLAETSTYRDKLLDMVSFQNDREIFLFDSNQLNASGKFPLDYRGVPVSGALRYPELIDQYNGGRLRFSKTTVQSVTTYMNVFGGIVRTTTEGAKSNI